MIIHPKKQERDAQALLDAQESMRILREQVACHEAAIDGLLSVHLRSPARAYVEYVLPYEHSRLADSLANQYRAAGWSVTVGCSVHLPHSPDEPNLTLLRFS